MRVEKTSQKKSSIASLVLLLFFALLLVNASDLFAGEVIENGKVRNPGAQTSNTIEDVTFNMRLAPAATFPLGKEDKSEAKVDDYFWITETPVTYELWYEVRGWAEDNGYTFQNKGTEGSHENTGQPPSDKMKEPVTSVNWYDSIVWCNALSEYEGYEPVYTINGEVLRNSEELTKEERAREDIRAGDTDGFRLPGKNEWELAARYRGNDSSHGALEYPEDSGQYWIPGNYASGATGSVENVEATKMAAWYKGNSDNATKEVGLKPDEGNKLGLFDMSGNVYEWCCSGSQSSRIIRGGSWFHDAFSLQVGALSEAEPSDAREYIGFRFLRVI